ncbi:flagellar basal body P-ring formation chaperone FlgA [Alsobacter sp. R-9]
MTLSRLTLRLGAAGLALVLALPAAAQQPRGPVLRNDVTVARETVTLGDLIENAGTAGETPVFRAPALGKNGTIQVSRVIDAARQAGLVPSNPSGAVQVTVTRAARKIGKTELEAAARDALVARYGMEEPEVTVGLDNGETTLFVEPDAQGDLKLLDLFYDSRSRRIEATLSLPGSRLLALKPVRLTGSVVDLVSVPVLTRAIPRGEAVREGDVRLERRARQELPQGVLTGAVTLSGKVTRSQLQAGAILRDGDLVKQDVVDKNSVVTVVYEGPGINLTMRAKALESGGVGDAILVQNMNSRRQVQGVVVAPGKVAVTSSLPGPVASALSAPSVQ